MDRKVKTIDIEVQESRLIYNIVGFIPATDFIDNNILISNIAYLISQKGFNTCILDFKVFYPNIYQYLDCNPLSKGEGLLKVLQSDKVDIRDEIISTKYDRLYLLSPSPYDLMEEYFDFDFSHIESLINIVKEMFDIVLIDIPNIPPLEFCIGAMKYSHIGFFTFSERLEAPNNMNKLLKFISSIGINPSKYMNVINLNYEGLTYDYSVFDKMDFKIVATLPYIKSAISSALEGKIYVRDNPLLNREYLKACNEIVDILINEI